eukprot:jgi/Mesen1/6457/ME000033S05757
MAKGGKMGTRGESEKDVQIPHNPSSTKEDLQAIQADVASFAATLGLASAPLGPDSGFDDRDFRKKGSITQDGGKKGQKTTKGAHEPSLEVQKKSGKKGKQEQKQLTSSKAGGNNHKKGNKTEQAGPQVVAGAKRKQGDADLVFNQDAYKKAKAETNQGSQEFSQQQNGTPMTVKSAKALDWKVSKARGVSYDDITGLWYEAAEAATQDVLPAGLPGGAKGQQNGVPPSEAASNGIAPQGPGKQTGKGKVSKKDASKLIEKQGGGATGPGQGGVSAPHELQRLVEAKREEGQRLLQASAEAYERLKERDSDARWLATARQSGTSSDKVSAMTVVIQEDPLANYRSLDALLGMVQTRGGKRHAGVAMDALRELFLMSLLPDRKLRYLAQQPLQALPAGEEGQRLLLFWYWEDFLKERYARFVEAVEAASRDTLDFYKERALKALFELLRSKPEQEQRLLTALINKDKWNKKGKGGGSVEKGGAKGPDGGEVGDEGIEVDSRVLAALLTGVNRAFPYLEADDAEAVVQKHSPALFRMVHAGSMNVGVQALSLLQQLLAAQSALSARYFRALYAVLLSPVLAKSSKSMRADIDSKRIAAFAKRLLQVAMQQPPQFACGVLMLLSEVLKARPALWCFVAKELDDELEHFVDAPDDDAAAADVAAPAGTPSADKAERAVPSGAALAATEEGNGKDETKKGKKKKDKKSSSTAGAGEEEKEEEEQGQGEVKVLSEKKQKRKQRREKEKKKAEKEGQKEEEEERSKAEEEVEAEATGTGIAGGAKEKKKKKKEKLQLAFDGDADLEEEEEEDGDEGEESEEDESAGEEEGSDGEEAVERRWKKEQSKKRKEKKGEEGADARKEATANGSVAESGEEEEKNTKKKKKKEKKVKAKAETSANEEQELDSLGGGKELEEREVEVVRGGSLGGDEGKGQVGGREGEEEEEGAGDDEGTGGGHRRGRKDHHAERACWWELEVLAAHVHPSVAAMARTLLAGVSIQYAGDPLRDLTLGVFLDRFAEKKPKPRRAGGAAEDDGSSQRIRGSSLMQPVRKMEQYTALAVGRDEFAALEGSAVAAEDVFFHKFYAIKASQQSKPKRAQKELAGDDDSGSSDDGGDDDDEDDLEAGVEGGEEDNEDEEEEEEDDDEEALDSEEEEEVRGRSDVDDVDEADVSTDDEMDAFLEEEEGRELGIPVEEDDDDSEDGASDDEALGGGWTLAKNALDKLGGAGSAVVAKKGSKKEKKVKAKKKKEEDKDAEVADDEELEGEGAVGVVERKKASKSKKGAMIAKPRVKARLPSSLGGGDVGDDDDDDEQDEVSYFDFGGSEEEEEEDFPANTAGKRKKIKGAMTLGKKPRGSASSFAAAEDYEDMIEKDLRGEAVEDGSQSSRGRGRGGRSRPRGGRGRGRR